MMSFTNLFIGSAPSKYAALAILAAVLVVSFALLFGRDPVPFTQKMAFVLMVFLISLPGILLTLFQMTCLVTGAGFRNQRWWCSAYAWIVSALLIVYCVMLIAVAIVSLATGEKVLSTVMEEAEAFENMEKMSIETANQEAREYFVAADQPAAEQNETTPGDINAVKQKMEQAPPAAPAAPAAPTKEAFKVAGGASIPADISTQAEPEAFDDMEMEPFTSCASAY